MTPRASVAALRGAKMITGRDGLQKQTGTPHKTGTARRRAHKSEIEGAPDTASLNETDGENRMARNEIVLPKTRRHTRETTAAEEPGRADPAGRAQNSRDPKDNFGRSHFLHIGEERMKEDNQQKKRTNEKGTQTAAREEKAKTSLAAGRGARNRIPCAPCRPCTAPAPSDRPSQTPPSPPEKGPPHPPTSLLLQAASPPPDSKSAYHSLASLILSGENHTPRVAHLPPFPRNLPRVRQRATNGLAYCFGYLFTTAKKEDAERKSTRGVLWSRPEANSQRRTTSPRKAQ